MAQPTTPSTRTGLVGKLFSKLRTPNSGSPSQSRDPSNNSGRSSPSLSLRRSSSRSSFHCLGSGPSSTSLNSSSGHLPLATALGLDSDDELELPRFESDVLRNLQRSTGERITVGNASPYTSKLPGNSTTSLASTLSAGGADATSRPSFDRRRSPPTTNGSGASSSSSGGVDSSGDGLRKSTFLSRNAASSTLVGRGWAKSKGALSSRSRTTSASASEVESEGEVDEATARADEAFKSPPMLGNSLSRSTASRTAAAAALSSSSSALSSHDTTTPHLPRAGLTGKSITTGNSWLERTARSGAAAAQEGGAKRTVRRAQRAPPPPPAAEGGAEEGGELPSEGSQSESSPPLASTFASSTSSSAAAPPAARRPPVSPVSHGRSRSELPPSSPRHEGAIAAQSSAERQASTVIIGAGGMSREGYARRNLVSAEERAAAGEARSASALGHYGQRTSPPALGEFGLPARPASSLAGSLSRSQRGGPPPTSLNAHSHASGPQSSAALRQRMLYSSSSSSASAAASATTNSPPLAGDSQMPSPPLSSSYRLLSEPSSASSSGSSASALGSSQERENGRLESRRTAMLEETASRLSRSQSQAAAAQEETERRTSPKLVPYAKRLSLSTTASHPVELSRSASLSRTPSDEPTMMASSSLPPRPGSSTAMYRDPSPSSSSSTIQPSTVQGQEARPRLGQSGSFLLQQRERERALREREMREAEEREREADRQAEEQERRAREEEAERQYQQQQQQGYGDENAYAGQSQHPFPSTTTAATRTPLAETYRSTSNPHPPPQHSQQPQAYPKDRQQATRPSPSTEQQYSLPPPNHPLHAHAAATPSMTHQAHYSSQQQQQQQYHQQPYAPQQQGQQTPMYGQQGMTLQQEYQVPIQKSVKKGPAVIVVNGKPYARAGILGKGGSSRVYRVLDEKNNLFAIKKVDISKNDAESRASFINEIHLLEKLRGNAQIIRLVDSEINDQKKVLLMVMEVGETDLNNLLIEHSGKAISMNFIRYIWEQMLEAVQVIHDENVVHTDLKPANFVLVKGRLKLIDFGISKAIANDTTNIGRDQQIGTANYMPPEALIDSGLGRDGKRLMKLGRAADVWSLGCILHQMVYGRTPFSHLRDVSHKIMAIQNPRHVIQFADYSCPVDERGEQKKGMEVKVGEEVKDTMRSCLRFDQRKRMTIPELLGAPFLRGEGRREAERVEEKKSNSPTIDEATMNALLKRVSKMLTGEPLGSAQGQLLASKLMNELRATQASI